eukprot:scaffold2639_cov95-Isochrysis_galbana.AAC.9
MGAGGGNGAGEGTAAQARGRDSARRCLRVVKGTGDPRAPHRPRDCPAPKARRDPGRLKWPSGDAGSGPRCLNWGWGGGSGGEGGRSLDLVAYRGLNSEGEPLPRVAQQPRQQRLDRSARRHVGSARAAPAAG